MCQGACVMRLSELSDDQLAAIRTYRYDGIVEKHEGPWNWSDVLEYEPPEFLMAGKYAVLLLVRRSFCKFGGSQAARPDTFP